MTTSNLGANSSAALPGVEMGYQLRTPAFPVQSLLVQTLNVRSITHKIPFISAILSKTQPDALVLTDTKHKDIIPHHPDYVTFATGESPQVGVVVLVKTQLRPRLCNSYSNTQVTIQLGD